MASRTPIIIQIEISPQIRELLRQRTQLLGGTIEEAAEYLIATRLDQMVGSGLLRPPRKRKGARR